MKIPALMIVLLVVIFIAAAIPASAQYGGMWNIRAGAAFPSGDTVDDAELVIGVETKGLGRGTVPCELEGAIGFSADLVRITTSTVDGEDDVDLIPIFLNWKTRPYSTY